MKRLASAVLAVAVVAAPALTTVAVAQTKMDCGKLYKDLWEKLEKESHAKISAEQLAGVSRMALRAYDACQAGDELDAKALFDKLSKMNF
jgi:Ni/Co efflux regulator RcnB